MGLKFRRGTTAQQSGSLAFGEPYVNTTLGTLVVGGATGDIVLSSAGTGSTGNFGAISGSGLDITGNANIAGNLTLGGAITIGDQSSDTISVVASVSSSLIPSNDNSFDVGSTSKRYLNVYAQNISASSFSNVTGSVNSLSYFSENNKIVSYDNSHLTNQTFGLGTSATSSGAPERLVVDNSGVNSYNIATFQTSMQNSYAEVNIKNFGSGSSSSTDLVIWNDETTEGSGYLDLGMNSSNYTADYVGYENDSYLYTNINDLYVGSMSSGSHGHLHLFGGGEWNTPAITIDNTNTINISSSIIPSVSNSIDLGDINNYFRDLYISTGSIKFVAGGAVVGTIMSGSSATTGSNIFIGNQTITGSLTITQDLVVLGSSSIQNITSSNLIIGAAYVTLNANSPSSRYAGLLIVDSGSVGASGSLLYDAMQDEFIFVHKGNGTNVTSSHFVLGPETYDDLGNESYLTNNTIPKGTGKEHLNNSNITDSGTLITLGSNAYVNGTFYATGTALVSGSSQITYANISSIPAGIVSGSSQVTPLLPTGTISGSAQVTLSSTTGYGTVINQNLLTTSDVRHNSLGIGMAASATAGRIDASGDIVAYSTSDRNFKENITPIPNALEKISKISGNTYDWKADMKEFHGFEGNDVGVIAQEIEEVLPQLVTTRETGYKAVKYDKLVALLIEGIKEQQTQIHSLTLEIEKLKESKGL